MLAASRSHTREVCRLGVVECTKCTSPVYVRKPDTIVDEFSVPCTKCGHRGLYLKRLLYTEELPERRRKPRN
jgi:DNA-directed RNA polymerase subunit RPC12/RpoP